MDRIFANLNPLTEGAIAFISLVGLYFQIKWSRRGVTLGPTLLTTLGIFFCFLGIALGLADFDPGDAKSTVPQLLQGIRTSFWASVSGIAWALAIKIRFVIFGDRGFSKTAASVGATMDDLVDQLRRIDAAISGEAEHSLSSLALTARVDTNERLDRLAASLNVHAQKAADTNAEVLVGALSVVVRDFNTTVNEQFGGNFVELNRAVGRLVDWQTGYEKQLNELIVQETATRQSMTEAAATFTRFASGADVFATTATSLATLMTELNAQRQHLEGGLQALASLIDKASGGLPQIEQSIVMMTDQISRGVQSNHEKLADVLKTSWQSIQVHNQQLTALLSKALDTANDDLTAHIKRANENTHKHVIALDKALEEEATNSMRILSRQLAQVADRFVDDYTPLMQRMQQVLLQAHA
jgi:hypothetical protein